MRSEARRDPAFFDDRLRDGFVTSSGRCELPILYQDASMLTAIWRVDAARARPLLPADLEPWLVLGRRYRSRRALGRRADRRPDDPR